MKRSNDKEQSTLSKSRRRLLLGSLGGVAAWQTPVIQSIILPAHAQMTDMAASFFGANVGAAPITRASPLDLLISPAYAGLTPVADEYTVEAIQMAPGSDTYDVGVFERVPTDAFETAEVVYRGTLTVGVAGTLAVADDPCGLNLSSIAAEISEASASGVVLNFTDRGQSLSVPPGDGALPVPMCVEVALNNYFIQDATAGPVAAVSPSLLDLVVPTAVAGELMNEELYSVSVMQTATDSFDVELLKTFGMPPRGFETAQALYSGTVTTGGGGTLSPIDDPCMAADGGIAVTVGSFDENDFTLVFSADGSGIVVPQGQGMLGAPMCMETPLPDSYFTPGSPQMDVNNTPSQKSILDYIVPEAKAGGAPPSSAYGLSAVKATETTYDVELLNPRGDVLRSGTLNINGDPGTLAFQINACDEGSVADVPASILSIDQANIVVQITQAGDNSMGAMIDITAPVGSDTLMPFCSQLPQ